MKMYRTSIGLLKKQAGMTFLEVLVSMLIIGLGLTITVSMMQASNRYGLSAEYRSAAMNEIQSIMDRMRANVYGGDGYVFGQHSYQDSGYDRKNIQALSAPQCGNPCETKEQLKIAAQSLAYARAQTDMIDWLGHVSTSLPGGQAAISKGAENTYTVTIMWLYGTESDLGLPSNKTSDHLSMTFSI